MIMACLGMVLMQLPGAAPTMFRLRTMTLDDVPLGMRLKGQAGWNQIEADWRRLLALEPEGCFVAEFDGQPVGTTCVTVFDSIAWISMVLVEKSVRGRGIGTRLMQHALGHLDARGVRTVRLDATPLGRPVHEKLGFAAEYDVARWATEILPSPTGRGAGGEGCPQVIKGSAESKGRREEGKKGGEGCPPVTPATAEQLEGVFALDRQATGTNRRRLIEQLHGERPEAMHVFTAEDKSAGYAWLRQGSRAVQIGPAVALNADVGRGLFDAAFDCRADQPVFIDIPVPNVPATRWAESHGLKVQRLLTRMYRGASVVDDPTQLWASFGPEKG
jgi:GNAT superfamily N-acetyltransferase